ncbi:hypothetical protein KY342_00670 [Candidatus Woesearchaeota archaeon]|nr:hypothetical protein [Candidatus Woesearchaeota archaeon]
MNKKAQHSRNDMAIMYAICLLLVVLTIGTLYEIGILGDIRSSLRNGGGITGAVVVEDEQEENHAVFTNNTFNESVDLNG